MKTERTQVIEKLERTEMQISFVFSNEVLTQSLTEAY